MTELSRVDLIKALKTVFPARSFNSVLFNQGQVQCQNKTFKVSRKFESGVEGTVAINELIRVLAKLRKGYPLELSQNESEVVFKCGPTTLRMYKLTDKHNPKPFKISFKWAPAPARLLDGLRLSLLSATEWSEKGLAGIVVTGNKIVSTNNYKISLYEMDGEVWPELLRLDTGSVKDLLKLKTDFDSIAVADGWLYFKNETIVTGVKLMFVEKYPLEDVLKVFDRIGNTDDLETYRLPKNLAEVIDNVSMFAGEGVRELDFDKMISLKTEDGNLIVRGDKDGGELECSIPWHRELPLGGIICSPSYLKEILPVSRSFKVNPNKNMLLFEAPHFKFLMLAGVPEPTAEEISKANLKKQEENCLMKEMREKLLNLVKFYEKGD